MVYNVVDILGRGKDDVEVVELIRALSLTEVSDAPLSRQYIGSKARGIDLLVENGRVFSIQIYLKLMQGFSVYVGALPFGIKMGMRQDDVHNLLGMPPRRDKSYSSYVMKEDGLKLTVDFDVLSEMKFLSITIISRD